MTTEFQKDDEGKTSGMKIAVIGAGAMGQLFAARLEQSGNDVLLIDVDKATVAAINDFGVTVKGPTSTLHSNVKAAVAEDISTPLEMLIVFTKGFHTKAAVNSVRHLITDTTVGLTLQNGLGNEVALADVLGPRRTLMGMTDFPADRLDTTVIGTAMTGRVVLGDMKESGSVSENAGTVAGLLDRAGLNAAAHMNVRNQVWEKLIFNTVSNTIGGATGLTVGQVGNTSTGRRLVQAVFREALNVAAAKGIEVNEKNIIENLEMSFIHHAGHKTSMTVDVEAGRCTEIETIGGAVETAGKKAGVPTPVLSALCDIIRLRTPSS